jgi:peptide-methionine (S)-S-oxide reductase
VAAAALFPVLCVSVNPYLLALFSFVVHNPTSLHYHADWGTEKYVVKDFQKRFPGSIKKVAVGFMSPEDKPRIQKPSYQDVCTGRTGHVEVLWVELADPAAHFEELVRFFFMFHDPTTKNRQGNDAGTQYASWIFCGDDKQLEIAKRVRTELQTLLDQGAIRTYAGKQVTTAIGPLKEFVPAHEAHQRYLEKNPNGYCNHRFRFKEWPQVEK